MVSCRVSSSTLWPPNDKLVPVQVTVAVTDAGGSGPDGYTLTSITSDQGNIADEEQNFVAGTDSTSGQLRAARSGNTGRIYTLTYAGRDKASNSASCSATVSVPRDQGR